MTGEIYSSGAVCLSACPLLLAGGVRRISSPFALIGVHQITTTYREVRVQYRTEYEMLNGKKKILSQREVGRKMVGKHDTTKLGAKQRAALIAEGQQRRLLHMRIEDRDVLARRRGLRRIHQASGSKFPGAAAKRDDGESVHSWIWSERPRFAGGSGRQV